MPSRMQGTPWHIGYVKAKDERRHRSRCIYFIPKHGCRLIGNCCGSSHCEKYKEKLDEKENKTADNLDQSCQHKSKGEAHRTKNICNKNNSVKPRNKGIKVGDTVELFNPIDGFEIKVQIVEKSKACLEEGRISADTPIGKAVLGKRKGDIVMLYMDENVVYEIVGWVKGS